MSPPEGSEGAAAGTTATPLSVEPTNGITADTSVGASEFDLDLVQIRAIDSIRPSPENNKVYNPPDVAALAEDIKRRGQLEPIVITQDGFILSGHRRYAACERAGLKEVKCRVDNISRGDPDFIARLVAYNNQRVKGVDELIREEVVKANPKEARRALKQYRERDLSVDDVDLMQLRSKKKPAEISKAKQPLLDAVWKILNDRRAHWPLWDRQVHYLLLNNPPLIHASKPDSTYRNNHKSYRAVVDILTRGRLVWELPFEAIDDATRPVVSNWGYPNVQPFLKNELDQFLKGYYRNLQQSQPCHIEIIGEKNTIQSSVKRVASEFCIPYTIGRGYCSLSPRCKLVDRFYKSKKDCLVLLALSDCDPDGEEIAHSFARSLRDDFGIDNIKPIKVALTRKQVDDMGLPPMLQAKETSANYNRFMSAHGDEVHELEAVEPEELEQILEDAICSVLDIDLYNAEIDHEENDAAWLEDIRRQAHKFLGSLTLGQGPN